MLEKQKAWAKEHKDTLKNVGLATLGAAATGMAVVIFRGKLLTPKADIYVPIAGNIKDLDIPAGSRFITELWKEGANRTMAIAGAVPIEKLGEFGEELQTMMDGKEVGLLIGQYKN